MNETNGDPFGHIWITSRVRMGAHAKFVRLDKLSYVLLTSYSVLLLGFSIFEPHLTETSVGPYSSEISIILSISILCASLVVWGLGFGEKARDHRECYLALQKLYNAPMDSTEKITRYHEVLERYPNHSDLDFERFLFRKLWIEGATVKNSNGPVKMGIMRAGKYILFHALSAIGLLLAIIFPGVVIFVIYVLF